MAGRKDKLTDEVFDEICELSKLQLSQKEIAQKVGIDPRTFRRWIAKGQKAKTGKYKKLADTLIQNQDEMIIQANKVVLNSLFFDSVKIVEKEVIAPDGRIVPLKTTTTTPPNPNIAIKFLERRDPRWHPKLEVDWKQLAYAKGINAEKLEIDFTRDFLEMNVNGEIPLPHNTKNDDD